MKNLIQFSVENRRAVVFVALLLSGVGLYFALQIPQGVFPDAEFPRVQILVDYRLAPLQQMQAEIVKPLEEAVMMVPGVEVVRSSTNRGSSEIDVQFGWHEDMFKAYQLVQAQVGGIQHQLPPGVEVNIRRITTSTFPVAGYSLYGEQADMLALHDLATYTIRPQLAGIPGIFNIEIVGGDQREYRINLDPEKLAAYRLDYRQVAEAIRATNAVQFVGRLQENNQLFLNIADNRFHALSDIANTVVAERFPSPVKLRDLATIEPASQETFIKTRSNFREAVLVNIVVQPGVNAVAVMRQVEERLAGIRSHFPPGVEMRKWYDLSDFIRNSIAGVYNSIFFGAGLTVLILLLFLRRLRITLVTALIIPVALLITFILIKLFGMDLNLMSLGGLAASIGILVDNAIVVVENIERFLEEGHDRSEAVILATQEIIAPLISATLTTLVVFAPLIFLSGVPGIFFRALAGTLSITVGVSMLLAMFLTPALAAILVSGKRRSAGRFLPRLVAFLHRILRFNFKFPVISGLLILALAGMAVFFYFAIPSGFLPEWDEGTLVLDFKAPPGSSVAGSYAMLATLEEHLAEIPEVADYSLRIGTSLGHPRLHPNEGDFLISLKKDRSRSVFDIMDELRSYAEGAEPRLEIELFQVLPDRLNSDLAGEVAPVVITLFGNNLPVMQESASQIAAALEKIPNVVDVYQGYETSEPELNIRIIPEIAARLGVSVAEVRRAVNMALWGETTTHVVEGLKVIPVQLRYPARDYRHLEEIRRLPVYLPELDRMITLEEVADIRKSPGLTDVENENLSLVVNVSAQLSGRDLGSVMKDVRTTLQRMSLPPGITLRIGGASESQRQAFYQLLLILGFGTLMVFAILLFEFKSFITAAIVMTGTLLSISGVFLLLWITGIPLDISAFMGMIMIIGVVVNNGILVIDYTEYYRRTSPDTAEALLAAVKVRLRPVLMTSFSTIIGFLPLALALGEGGEMLQPLAVSMIGGMSFSLLLSLVVIPVLYYTAHRGKEIINTPR